MSSEMRITIRDNGVRDRMRKIQREGGRLEIPHKRIAVYLDQWVHRSFDGDGAQLSSGKWPPYKYGGRLTTKAKANAKQDGRYVNTTAKLLRDTGWLYAHFNVFSSRESAGVGNEVPYSIFHEEGTEVLPQRRMLPRETEIIGRVLGIYDDYIKEVIE